MTYMGFVTIARRINEGLTTKPSELLRLLTRNATAFKLGLVEVVLII